jgi:endonuclease-3
MTASPLRRRAGRVVRALARLYPDAPCALRYADPFQLLVAVILSAQCTDAQVNRVMPALFARFPDAAALAAARPHDLEKLIHSTGFFRAKARNLRACARARVERHGGAVPATMEELTALPGVGRKTANVVLGNAFGIPGIPVDTHVGRLSRRLGLTAETDPEKVERDLNALVPRKEWTMLGHRLIHHGRQVCHARRPECGACGLAKWCPSREADGAGGRPGSVISS